MAIDANMYVLNPVFKADTFQETVAPLQLYAQAYKEQEAKVEDMTDKAAALEYIANQNPDSQTAALYRDMSNKIKGLRDDIMTNGLMGGLRSRILGARRTYSANSAEITRRYQDMQKYQERMEQMYDKDNSMVFSPESTNVTIDSFAGGNRPKIKAISGNEIMARGAAVGKRLTSQIFGDGVEGTVAGEQFWKFYKENGMTDKALQVALDNVGQGDKYSMVKKVIDGVYGSFADFDPESQNILKNRFIEGVYDGAVYSRDVQYMQNEDHMNPYESAQIRWGDNQDARANAEEFRSNLDWEFANGRAMKKIWVTDENGERVQRGLAYDPYTGKQSLVDLKTQKTLDTNYVPNKKEEKKEKPKQPNIKPMAVYKSGQTAPVPKSDGTIIPTNSEEYLTAVKAISKQYPDVTPDLMLAYCNVYKTSGNDKNTIYYSLPKTIKPEPEESTQTGSGSGGEEDTVTE